jgi:uncharacterized membrane protein
VTTSSRERADIARGATVTPPRAIVDVRAAAVSRQDRRPARRRPSNTREAAMPEARGQVVVGVGVEDAFEWWADGMCVPRALAHGAVATTGADGTWSWDGPGPDGENRRWTGAIAGKVRFQRLEWRASAGDLEQTGELRFRPVEGRTEVGLRLAYRAPDGAAEGFGEDAVRDHVEDALARFKALVELGAGPGAEPEDDDLA